MNDKNTLIVDKKEAKYLMNIDVRAKDEVLGIFSGFSDPGRQKFYSEIALKKARENDQILMSNLGVEKKLTKNERYLLMFLVSSQKYTSTELRDLRIERDALNDLFYDIEDKDDAIRRATKGLFNNRFSYYEGNDDLLSLKPIVSHAKIDKDDNGRIVQIKINPDFVKIFTDYTQGNWTSFILSSLIKLKPFSQTIYLQLKNLDGKNRNNRQRGPISFYMSIAELMNIVGSRRARFAALRKDILEPALLEINSKTDMKISFKKLSAKEKRNLEVGKSPDGKIELGRKYSGVEIEFTTERTKKDLVDRLLHAKNDICGEMMDLFGDGPIYRIVDFKPHPAKDNVLTVTLLTTTDEEFTESIKTEAFAKPFRGKLKFLDNKNSVPGEKRLYNLKKYWHT